MRAGTKPGRFCSTCPKGGVRGLQGDGSSRSRLHFCRDVYVTCTQRGKRYNRETLEVPFY